MSLISRLASALAVMTSAIQTVGAGIAASAKASPPTGGSKPGTDPCEPTEEMKKEAEKASLPGCAFTIREETGPIKEEPFKPEPLPPAPPKPPPLPPKKLAPISRASATKPLPLRPKASAPAPASKPVTALGKAAARFDKLDAAAGQKQPQEATRSM